MVQKTAVKKTLAVLDLGPSLQSYLEAVSVLEGFKQENKDVLDVLKTLESNVQKTKTFLVEALDKKNLDGLSVFQRKVADHILTLETKFSECTTYNAEGIPGTFRRYFKAEKA